MNKNDILSAIKAYLSDEFKCEISDLEKSDTTYTINNSCKSPYIQIMTFRESIIVSSSPELSSKIKPLLQGLNKDEIFEFPYVYGQTIHYVPDLNKLCEMPLIDEYTYELIEGDDVNKLVGETEFENSLTFDNNRIAETSIVLCAKKDDKIIGLAGASIESENIWEVGIDVLPKYRKNGLGAMLISNLSIEILKKGIVPIYSASITNVASQMVATRSGYVPCWVDTFGNILDGSSPYNTIVSGLTL